MSELELQFKKSSFSTDQNEQCVDVAITKDNVVVRHSKKHDVQVFFTHGEWKSFISGVKNQEFDL